MLKDWGFFLLQLFKIVVIISTSTSGVCGKDIRGIFNRMPGLRQEKDRNETQNPMD
jgi:hypothetical protein